jgi:hypothetical protein
VKNYQVWQVIKKDGQIVGEDLRSYNSTSKEDALKSAREIIGVQRLKYHGTRKENNGTYSLHVSDNNNNIECWIVQD